MSMKTTRTILITGASSGFGAATATKLAHEGHTLILLARRKDRLESLQKALATETYIAPVDVSDKQQVAKFFEALPKKYRNIDVLINNAGLARGMGTAQESKLEDWERMVDTNIKGLLYMTHPVLKIMTARGTGHIINIGSVSGSIPYKGSNVYGATKAFVRQFSRNLRTDVFGQEIKITTVEPGMAETEFSEVRLGDKSQAKTYYQGTRPLQAENIADAIVWVLDQPPHVNIDNIEIMSLDQTYGGTVINRHA